MFFAVQVLGTKPEYAGAAKELGEAIAGRKLCLVYGGARVGLMGEISSAVLNAGGEVIGVIPTDLVEKEVARTDLSDLRVVNSMHERKSLMSELSDGFIALPGGFGTIEEMFEVLTWSQLDFHQKPCGFLNINGYYDYLLKFLDHTAEERFIQPAHRSMILVDENPGLLIDKFLTYKHPKVDKIKWLLDMLPKNS